MKAKNRQNIVAEGQQHGGLESQGLPDINGSGYSGSVLSGDNGKLNNNLGI